MRSILLAVVSFLVGSFSTAPLPAPAAAPALPLDVPGLEAGLLVSPPVSPKDCARLESALRAVGWPALLLPTMLAIAKAESGCRPEARLATFREESVGPLQINIRAHPWVTSTCAQDFVCASWAALRIYRMPKQGLRAWMAYRSGAYRRFL